MNSYCKKSLLAVKMVHLVQCKHNVFKTQPRQFVLSIPAGKMTSGAILALYLLDEGEYSFHTFYPNCHTIICDMTPIQSVPFSYHERSVSHHSSFFII